ncbi:hypothetical protein AAFF_G00113060 [Aldrovandia affinis]|uniref:Transposase IS30-like HTH domain-containing protein n=1 Tax=Aldrovandia affinis TaxID=143900 RepID=A0AAD7RT21_9TELE|nr:hypothetical protein AAFF_G00113060 [Aldrovandia affinis]
MSGFDNKPFADRVDVNPFQDSLATEVTAIAVDRVEEFNPFSDSTTLNTQTATTAPAPSTLSQPAVQQASEEPSPQVTVAAAQADLLQQQEELERKEEDLQRSGAPTDLSCLNTREQKMGKKVQLSKEKRESIITLRNEGQSLRRIARTLQVSVTAVATTIKRVEETGTHEDRMRSGRPKVTSESENKFIRVTSLRNQRLTAPEIQAQLNASRSKDVSTSTVRRRLRVARRILAAKKHC